MTEIVFPGAPEGHFWKVYESSRWYSEYQAISTVVVELVREDQIKKLFGRGYRIQETVVYRRSVDQRDLRIMKPESQKERLVGMAQEILSARRRDMEFSEVKSQVVGEYR